jgi:hypothetical protein
MYRDTAVHEILLFLLYFVLALHGSIHIYLVCLETVAVNRCCTLKTYGVKGQVICWISYIPVFNIDVRDTVQLNRNCLTYNL